MKGTMARLLAGLMFAGMFGAAIQAADTTEVSNDAFSISLPVGFGEFATQTQKSKAPEGEIETTNYVSKSPTGEAIVVTVSKMPAKILDPQKLMSSTRDTLLTSLKAKLESEEKTGDGITLLFKGQTENPPYLRSQLEVQEDRFYQVLYVGRNEQQRALPSVAQVFESFKIAPQN